LKNYEVVCVAAGDTSRKELRVPIVDSSGAAVDITGSTLTLVGHSDAMPSKAISLAGSVVSPGTGGVARFPGIGSVVNTTELAGRESVVFPVRVKYSDASGVDFTEKFTLTFVEQP
jgi:hypothetical protein